MEQRQEEENKRPIAGGNAVYLAGSIRKGRRKGSYIYSPLAAIRLITSRGADITDNVLNALKVTIRKGTEYIGKVSLADEEGEPIDIISILSNILSFLNPVKVQTKTVSCPPLPLKITGIGAGAEGTLDCLGDLMQVKVPKSGTILSATYWDLDDEKTQVDLEIFKERITQTGDNNPWAPSDVDLLHFVKELAFFAFDDHINNATSEINNIGKAYTCPQGYFYIQAKLAGTAQTIAAGSEPRYQLQILSDDPNWQER